MDLINLIMLILTMGKKTHRPALQAIIALRYFITEVENIIFLQQRARLHCRPLSLEEI